MSTGFLSWRALLMHNISLSLRTPFQFLLPIRMLLFSRNMDWKGTSVMLLK